MLRKISKSLKVEKRQDEDSLYMLIKRDIEKQILFPGCSDYTWQEYLEKQQKSRIDFLIQYAPPIKGIGCPDIKSKIDQDYLFGVEVKFDFPKKRDFDQAINYLNTKINGIFLAYPADRIGEAVSELQKWCKGKNKVSNIGLIAISPYRCLVVQKGLLITKNKNKFILDVQGWGAVKDLKETEKDLKKIKNSIEDIKRLEKIDYNLLSVFYSFNVEKTPWTGIPSWINSEEKYSVGKIYKKVFSKYSTQNKWDILIQENIIEFVHGFDPYIYMISQKFPLKSYEKVLLEKNYSNIIKKIRTSIRNIINEQFVIMKESYFNNKKFK